MSWINRSSVVVPQTISVLFTQLDYAATVLEGGRREWWGWKKVSRSHAYSEGPNQRTMSVSIKQAFFSATYTAPENEEPLTLTGKAYK